jgi:hypothetical protein
MDRKDANEKILKILQEEVEKNGEHLRFGQILFNLGINEFSNRTNPENGNFLLRDIYNDEPSKILDRVLKNRN